jgi:4,5-DOPA dioxygenase extradiol
MSSLMPTLFLSHGAPDILLSEDPTVAVFRGLGGRLPRPRAIAVVSAHWTASPVGVTGPGDLATIHDFGGFAEALYRLRYPARGDAGLTASVGNLLETAGIAHRVQEGRGLDHGAWIPLSLIYPDAEIPVIQISLPTEDLGFAARLGEALTPLSLQGVLVIGSGGSVHNLRLLRRAGPPDPWALGFESWLWETVQEGRFDRLLDPARHRDDFARAHPTLEHFAPLVVAWVAGGVERPGLSFHQGFTYGNLGMGCYIFGEPALLRPTSG